MVARSKGWKGRGVMGRLMETAARKRGLVSGLIRRGSDRLAQVLRWVKRRFGGASVRRHDAILAAVAHHKGYKVTDVASRLKLRLGPTIAAMTELERQGLVRLSKDKNPLNRVVAITSKGRKELKQ